MWVNLGALRDRVRRMAERLCRRAGLENVTVSVRIVEAASSRPRGVEILVEERRDVDGTDSKWDFYRGGRSWEEN